MPSFFDAWIDLSEMDILFSVLRSSEILRLSLLDDDNVEDEEEDDSKDRADFSGGGRHTTV